MKKLELEIGKQFGRWTVLKELPSDHYGRSRWLCQCNCGTIKSVVGTLMVNGYSKSCGCLHRELASVRGQKNRMNLYIMNL